MSDLRDQNDRIEAFQLLIAKRVEELQGAVSYLKHNASSTDEYTKLEYRALQLVRAIIQHREALK